MKKEVLSNGTIVYVNCEHRFGTDAMLLSGFCNVRRNEAVCDLGTGCGIIPLRFFDSGHRGRCVAVDICAEAVQLLSIAAAENGAVNIIALCENLKSFTDKQIYDIVSCNPPYFKDGIKSENETRRVARFEEACNLNDVCATAARLLKDGGRLCICQRPERLADAMCAMRENAIEPKVLRMVKQRTNEKPWLFLLQGQKKRAPGLRVLPDMVMENTNGEKSDELLLIYKEARA